MPLQGYGRRSGHREGRKVGYGHTVERISGYLCPVALPHGHDADSAIDALFDEVEDLPTHLRSSLTWDQGTEIAQQTALTLAADLPVYFAHAHSPWERGTNENTNGLIRDTSRKGRKFPVTLINYGRSMTSLMTGHVLFLASGRQAKCSRS